MKIHGIPFTALIDTATRISVLNQSVVVKIVNKILKSSTFIEVINGTSFEPKGEVEGKVEFGGDKKKIKFIVVQNFKWKFFSELIGYTRLNLSSIGKGEQLRSQQNWEAQKSSFQQLKTSKSVRYPKHSSQLICRKMKKELFTSNHFTEKA